ncbi:carbohydrate-binding protein [Paenibacillus lignilyticus]|uniref:Carbohydrate-binding protein n=1 Tax=Paenibacillus lignilyticus TaxID=1172615 RepID=A0ABS5C6G9_9BACL|nr:carbohydrate-binding protein [Paenibacillus lignilyticus]MBP3961503.1 carbohydrate-binding protein [Paenibacillus lignilyticus]
MKKMTLVLLACSMVFTLFGFRLTVDQGSKAEAAGYTAKLPKMPATSAVVVLDITKDKSEHSWESTEALLAITTIQGIVNRTSSTKIYLVNAPQKWTGIWNPPATDQWALDDGLVPGTKTYPTLNPSKRFPVLSYLVQNYASYIKGSVLYPSLSTTVNDSAVMAAITAAAQTDAIPLSSAIQSYLSTTEGKTYTSLADTRGFANEIDAFRWAKANYLNANTTKAFVAKHGFKYWGGSPALVPMTFDYYVASKAFIYSLDSNKTNERAEVASLLNTSNYPAGTPVLGEVNGELSELQEIEDRGYFFTFLDGANYSVHSSYASDPAAITAPAAPAASTIDNNGVFVAFYVTDGDNLSIAEYNHHNYWRNSGYKGQVPMGWSLPPMLLDLYPKKLQWLSANNYNNNYELIANYNDGSAPNTAAGETAFTTAYKDYLSNSNGLFRTMNYFDTSAASNSIITTINPYFSIRGYQGATNGNPVSWSSIGQIPDTTISGSTQSSATPQEIANAAKYVADHTAAGTPAFVVVSVGDGGHSGDPSEDAALAKAIMLNNAGGRNYHFLRPVDLAATWKAYSSPTAPSGNYEAESATLTGGVATYTNNYASGGQIAGSFYQGGAISFANVASGSSVQIRYANGSTVQGKASLYAGGTDVAQVTLPPTGSWDTFSTVTVNVAVGGTVKLQIDADDAATMGGSFTTAGNIDKITVSGTGGGGGQSSFEAEDATLAGGAAIFTNGGASGGQIVGSFYQGGSLTFTGAASGSSLTVRYANGSTITGRASLYVNGVDVAQIVLPPTGSWNTFSTVTVNGAVQGTIKIQIDADDASAMGGSFITAGNLDKITIN